MAVYVGGMASPPKTTSPKATGGTAEARLARVAGVVDAFRQGRPVLVRDGRTAGLVSLAVETATDSKIDAQSKATGTPGHLLLTHARAVTLKIRLYTEKTVAVPLKPDDTADRLRAIADPTADLAIPLKGPFRAERTPLSDAHAAAVKLAKLAGLLPAALVWPGMAVAANTPEISASEISGYEDDSIAALKLLSRARVPLEGAEKSELAAFRAGDGGPEHYAIVIDAPLPHEPVLTRLHSECFTGDLLSSLKCDCGAQLRGAIDVIAKSGGGILLYLAQEGRGIGLINKLRAYRLQDQGFDTFEANRRLGFEDDERLYGIAARMLTLLGYKSVRLLTNNPDKVAALEAAGIAVVERVPHTFPDNAHNRAYLKTKTEKAGHLF